MFFSLLVAIIVICVFDFKLLMKTFDMFTDWVKQNPAMSIKYSFLVIFLSIVFTVPISYSVIMLGYTYSQVYDSQWQGFLTVVPIIYSASILGGFVSFLISRYVFRDFIKEMIEGNEWLNDNFELLDDILTQDGMKVTSLIRLTSVPYGIVSYIIGVSNIPFRDYMIGNLPYILTCSTHTFLGCSLYTGSAGKALSPEL